VDLQRVLVLRTVSNYDREPPGTTVADSLKTMVSGNYSAYFPALKRLKLLATKSSATLSKTGPIANPRFHIDVPTLRYSGPPFYLRQNVC